MKHIFFDLDGTLVDSKRDLADSINHTLQVFNLKPLDDKEIFSFVGNGVRRLVEDTLLKKNKIELFDRFMAEFLDYYDKHLLDNTKLYDGFGEVLNRLNEKDIDMFVVSNKSYRFVYKILEGLGIKKYFKDFVGGDSFPFKKPDPYPIIALSKKHNIFLKNSFVVGDSENDILAAKNAKVKIGWVVFGFRDKGILKKFSVDYVINHPFDLIEIVR
ncbi:HAD family hydrolase [Hippea jasoniae]|uniref:HAD family hydrolase n=1 Tax=Hippea jasoniae TaxID=944479 RepID=UPI00054D512B|nr:HAD-IA family hydrolase [Hippea jasoniae]